MAAIAAASSGALASSALGSHGRAPTSCEEGSRLEMISKANYLKQKLPSSDEYYECSGGVRCCDLKVGSGRLVERGMLVGIHYEGFRLNGRQVESSWARGMMPVLIEAGGQPDFLGLSEGIIGMRLGGQRELIIPPRMNRPGVNEVHTYKVELIAISSGGEDEEGKPEEGKPEEQAQQSGAGPFDSSWARL
eukprot:CAMPEP_0170577374 /NCGR_PEP_ID=MMETSP0224-20130122/4893_1 /TAXON_ID=285029 /ORGANISM="Togula jolla, Strain CCCM 725" /LENGTH=190 /DNA_ID=CAMNT_0010900281 /DNA_START=140 /DNA_END=708 /DNA_ORIENTATION=+